MDVVVSYRHDAARWRAWPALAYLLHSLTRCYRDLGKVILVADVNPLRPDAVRLLPHAPPAPSNIWQKASNITRGIALACQENDVSDNFLWCCDDFLIMQPVRDSDFDVAYFEGSVAMAGYHPNSPFYDLMHETQRAVGHPCLNFCGHRPVRYNKRQFLDVLQRVGPAVQHETAYFNLVDCQKRKNDVSVLVDAKTRTVSLDAFRFVAYDQSTINENFKRQIRERYVQQNFATD